jgi:methyl-accepting chemotaxis protein
MYVAVIHIIIGRWEKLEFLDNMKIGKKLTASFLIIAIILGIVAVIGYMNMKSINDGMTTMYFDRTLPIQYLGITDALFYEIRGDHYKELIYPDTRAEIRAKISTNQKLIKEEMDKYRATSLFPEEKEGLAKFDAAYAEYNAKMKEHQDMMDKGQTKEVIDLMGAGAMTEIRKKVSDAINDLETINQKGAEEINNQGDATFASSTFAITLTGIIGVIAALAIGFILSKSISVPLGKGVVMMQEMSLGHLGTRLNMNRKDEIGVLAASMDSFSNDLQNIVLGAMKEIAAGNLSIEVSPKDDRDEIAPSMKDMLEALRGLVAEANMLSNAAVDGKLGTRGDINRFKGGYREIVEGVNATLDSVINPVNEAMRLSGSYAKGDYTDRVSDTLSVKGDFIPFRDALNHIGIQGSIAIGGVKNEIESLTAGMEETNASAEEVSSSTGMLAQSSSSVSVLAERSGSGIKQTLTAMEDLSNTVSAVATKAEQASMMAKQTVDLSEKGVTLAGKAEKGMEGIMHSVDETSVIINDITGQMEEIGKIVGVITGIAEQTGLLALNAAIEAARAGDAGMGFAVVADEVKALALESQKSAENIETIIGNLQKKSQLVSESMKSSATEVRTGNAAVSETLEVFNQIVQAINVVHSNMTEVAGATEEQAAAVEEITASVNEVGSLVQQTAKEAVDSAAATEEVTASIDQITRAISDAAASVQKISDEMDKFTVS